ncbi:hypothetical protein ABPG74_019284 [Tetrahymena malaccensis]
MSKEKKFSFIRYFDVFAPPYYQKINQDHYKKKTVVGGVFSIIYISASLGYFVYLMIYFYQGKTAPKFSQFDEAQDEEVNYKIQSEALFIQIYQGEQDVIEIENKNKIQYFDIYLKNQDLQVNSYYYENLIRFGSDDTILSLNSYLIPLQGDNIEITIQKCSGNLLRDQNYRCASEIEIQQLFQKQDLVAVLSIGNKSFSLKKDEFKTRVFFSIFSISINSQVLNLIDIQLQEIQIQKGLIFQTSKKYVQIVDIKQQTVQQAQRSPDNETYNSILIILNSVVRQTQVQYPLLSEVLAYVWGITSMLLLTGYIFRCLAQATLAQDFLGIQLKYYYKKTAIRLFGQDDNEKINNSIIESKIQAEAIIKQNETNKDMCVFEMQKEFLKMRTAIKLLLTPEQYSAIQMCGCDLVNEEQIFQDPQKQDQKSNEIDSHKLKDQDDKFLDLEISDIHSPLNKYQLDHSDLQISQQKALNHLEIMNKVDTDYIYRQDCLQRFLNNQQQNESSDQQRINKRIKNCIIGIQNASQNKTNEIYSNGVCGSGLSAQLAQCINLENLSINLHKSNLEDEDIQDLGNSLEKCQNLTNLNLKLDTNHISDNGASYLGISLSKIQNLRCLNIDLWTNQIQDQGLLSLSQGIRTCQQLRSLELTLCDNSIGNKGAVGLLTSLQSCYSLKSLTIDFSSNSFNEQFGFHLGNALVALCQLKCLNLILSNSYSQALDDTDCSNLCTFLAQNKSIILLNLEIQNNNCWFLKKQQLEIQLKKMKNLIKLDFKF